MTSNHNATVGGLPSWIGIVRNDTVAYINDILLATVNGSCAIFALLSNMAIIVAVSRNPSLQKRSSILLCGLAFADCLVLPRVVIISFDRHYALSRPLEYLALGKHDKFLFPHYRKCKE